MARILGSKKADYIDTLLVSSGVNGGTATDTADSITAGAGDDEVHGGGGNDTIIGDSGNDRLYGDAGNDQLDGGTGDDYLWGGIGNDNLLGSDGRDRLDGGDGSDWLNGGRGDDVSTGGAGTDIFIISSGNDVITDFRSFHDVQHLIDFTDLIRDGTFIAAGFPSDYAGLTWNNFFFTDFSFNARIGTNGTEPGTIDFNGAVKLVSVDLFAGTGTISWVGYLGGQVVASGFVDGDGVVHRVDIGSIVVDSIVVHDSTANAYVDNITYIASEQDQDLLSVSAATDIGTLLASARDDGSGNTVMGHGPNTVTLLGVASAAVSADWFVIG